MYQRWRYGGTARGKKNEVPVREPEYERNGEGKLGRTAIRDRYLYLN